MDIRDTIDSLCDLFESAGTPEKVRDTSNYQFILALANRLMERDPEFSASMANEVATSVDVNLPREFYRVYPAEFDRLVDGFASALLGIYHTLQEDFNDEAYAFFLKNAGKMNLSLEF